MDGRKDNGRLAVVFRLWEMCYSEEYIHGWNHQSRSLLYSTAILAGQPNGGRKVSTTTIGAQLICGRQGRHYKIGK
jgi:hypothetical protein